MAEQHSSSRGMGMAFSAKATFPDTGGCFIPVHQISACTEDMNSLLYVIIAKL